MSFEGRLGFVDYFMPLGSCQTPCFLYHMYKNVGRAINSVVVLLSKTWHDEGLGLWTILAYSYIWVKVHGGAHQIPLLRPLWRKFSKTSLLLYDTTGAVYSAI